MIDIAKIPVINDKNYQKYARPLASDKKSALRGRGLKPRDFKSFKPGAYKGMPVFAEGAVIPESEWADRLASQKESQGSGRYLREREYDVLKSMDQDGLGLCWAFSSTKACLYRRARANVKAILLSAWWVAGKVKGWRDQGGWCQQSIQCIQSAGAPELRFCPGYRSSYDTQECRDNALLHQITEWYDGTDSREQNRRIMISAFLMGLNPILDLNWMGHSMCGAWLESINPLKVVADNSWGENSGEQGLYVLEGTRAIPDNIAFPAAVELNS